MISNYNPWNSCCQAIYYCHHFLDVELAEGYHYSSFIVMSINTTEYMKVFLHFQNYEPIRIAL